MFTFKLTLTIYRKSSNKSNKWPFNTLNKASIYCEVAIDDGTLINFLCCFAYSWCMLNNITIAIANHKPWTIHIAMDPNHRLCIQDLMSEATSKDIGPAICSPHIWCNYHACVYPPKSNIAPWKNDKLEDDFFLLKGSLFRGELLNFGGVVIWPIWSCKHFSSLKCQVSLRRILCFITGMSLSIKHR